MPKYAKKNIARDGCHLFFFSGVAASKIIIQNPETMPKKTSNCFGESLQGGKVVRELQIF